jgi:putative transposase
MEVVRTFKYRVYPTRRQVEQIDSCLEISRLVYNHLLAEKRDAWKYEKKNRSMFDLCKQTKGNKILHAVLVRGTVHRVDASFKNFFRRCKDPTIKEKGFPRFKSANRFLSLNSPYEPNPEKIGITTFFPQIGRLKTAYDRPFKGTPKTLTLKKTPTGKYFITIACEIEIKVPKRNRKPAVGIDVGLNHAIATSDGQFFDSPKPLKALSKKLTRQHRKFSRTKFRSNNHEKERIKLARIYERIADIRQDWSHKVTTHLAKTYGTIKVEALNISGMLKNHRLAKSISDVAWGDLMSKLAYKVEQTGGRLIKVDPRNTSQECSACGAVVRKTLSQRKHSCPDCGCVLDRDTNAAKNILNKSASTNSIELCEAIAKVKPEREDVRRRKSVQFSMKREAPKTGGIPI